MKKEEFTNRIKLLAEKHFKLFDQEIEFKNLDVSLLNYKDKIIPTRAFDSMRVWGDKELKKNYFKQLFDQLKSVPAGKYNKFSKDFRQYSIRQLSKVCSEKKSINACVNQDNGTLIYDGLRNLATKIPCLRSVQYHVAHLIFKGVKSGTINQQMFEDVRKQRSMVYKLDWLQKNNLVSGSPETMNQIADAYLTSLKWYAESQVNFCENQSNKYTVDPEQLKNVLATIESFVK